MKKLLLVLFSLLLTGCASYAAKNDQAGISRVQSLIRVGDSGQELRAKLIEVESYIKSTGITPYKFAEASPDGGAYGYIYLCSNSALSWELWAVEVLVLNGVVDKVNKVRAGTGSCPQYASSLGLTGRQFSAPYGGQSAPVSTTPLFNAEELNAAFQATNPSQSTLPPSDLFAQEKQDACVKYRTEYSWSKGYRIEASVMSGSDLNRAVGSVSRFNAFATYAVVFWGEGQATILKLPTLSMGNLPIIEQEVDDQDGGKWKIQRGHTLCY